MKQMERYDLLKLTHEKVDNPTRPIPIKEFASAGRLWLKAVILATQEAEIRRITV
jgi:hypothetical protein